MQSPGPMARVPTEDLHRWQSTIDTALEAARRQLRWRYAMRGLAASFFVPVLAAALWVGLSRLTLLDLPRWPALAILLLWLAGWAVWYRRLRVSPARCARYLDATLDLDERVGTCLEIEGRSRIAPLSPGMLALRRELIMDTSTALSERLHLIAHPFRYRFALRPALTSAAAIAVLVLALLVPTSLELVKSERSIVGEALEAQAQKLADLRAEIVARPELPENIRQNLAAELEMLEEHLRNAKNDRAEALAALAEAEERVRSLSPSVSTTDFESHVRAAQLVQEGATDYADWDPSIAASQNDLGKAAEAVEQIRSFLTQFTTVQARAAASALERAASVVAPKDAALAQSLQQAASALRRNDVAEAAKALDDAGSRFQAAEVQQQSAEAVENTLARLEDSREAVAKAGTTTANKRGQVGFRRANAEQNGAEAGSSEAGSDASGGAAALNADDSTAMSGQNSPAFGAQGSGSESPPTGTGPGTTGASQSGSSGTSGGNQSSAGQGTVQGPIAGPIGGASGTQAGSGEAAGSGTGSAAAGAGAGTQPNSQAAERVYVPGKGPEPEGAGGQAAPEPQPGDAVVGRAGEGSSEGLNTGGPGPGSLSTVHTPYTEVIGEYSKQATEALDRAYIPPDAKDYVRDYFTALGK